MAGGGRNRGGGGGNGPGDGPIVSVRDLRKEYRRGRVTVAALDGVSLGVERGEFVAVMGPSGSGKTTLLNQIGALDRPTSGTIVLDGTDITALPERRLHTVRRGLVGFVFQSFYLVPTMTALENVLLPTVPLGTRAYADRARELLEAVGLGDRAGHRPGELSGGEMQRVAIARALVLDPPLLLADEPTGNLDTRTGVMIFALLREFNRRRGKTVLMVTHNPELAGRCDRIIRLRDGRVEE